MKSDDFIANGDCGPLRAFGTCRAEEYFFATHMPRQKTI